MNPDEHFTGLTACQSAMLRDLAHDVEVTLQLQALTRDQVLEVLDRLRGLLAGGTA
jgi:hypothetical protein